MIRFNSKIQYGENVNIVFDGDSITYGDGSTGGAARYPDRVMSGAPFGGTLTTWSNVSQSGHRWHNGDTHGVDDAYEEGKINILIPWFGTNDMTVDNLSASQTAQEARRYIAKRFVAHPDWHIVLMTTIPRSVGGSNTVLNSKIDEYNTDLRKNYKSWGARAYIDNRLPGTFFDFQTYDEEEFEKSPSYYYVDNIHLSNDGYIYLAEIVRKQLRRLSR